jgi:hypothetical protein
MSRSAWVAGSRRLLHLAICATLLMESGGASMRPAPSGHPPAATAVAGQAQAAPSPETLTLPSGM